MKTIKLVTEGIYLMGYNEKNEACCYRPLTKEAKELDLPLLPNLFEEVDIDKIVDIKNLGYHSSSMDDLYREGFKEGYELAQSDKQFSLEDMLDAFELGLSKPEFQLTRKLKGDFDRFVQSLSTQQLPKEFIPEYVFDCCQRYVNCKGCDATEGQVNKRLKITINPEGKKEIQGTYKY